MKYARRLEIFTKVRAKHSAFLTSALWKLTGDKELFAEAMQYVLLGMWRNVEKLNGKKAAAYIYRIALTANSKAWRNRIGRDGQISESQIGIRKDPAEKLSNNELVTKIRQAISGLSTKQGQAVVMRYLEQQSYQAVAEKLNCSEAAARSNVSKAIATLKNKLASRAKGVK